MNTDELEEILNGGAETQRLDFKDPCSWEVGMFIKDILAMANVRDGGTIVVGVRETERGFIRIGVNDAVRDSYRIDIIRDQIDPYADPHVDISVHFPSDRNGMTYVALRVREFEEIPIICCRDGRDVTSGTLYYRNRNRRVESARISNANDMRDVITRAAVKEMKRLSGYGLNVNAPARTRLAAELGDL